MAYPVELVLAFVLFMYSKGIVTPAQWHEREGYIVEAIRHAQAAREWTLAARLLADHHIDLTFDGRTGSGL